MSCKINFKFIIVIILCLQYVGCAALKPDYVPVGSAAGGVYYVPEDESVDEVSGFQLKYENTIRFKRDLTVTVDSIFARLKSNDIFIQKALLDFVGPIEKLLGQKYNIYLTFPQPIPHDTERKFIVETEFSQWHEYELTDNSVNLLIVQLIDINNERNIFKIRGKVKNAEAEFNSLIPNNVTVRAQLILQMQSRSNQEKSWHNVRFKPNSIKKLGDQFRNDLNRTYYRYLSTKYNAEFDSYDFRGYDEK